MSNNKQSSVEWLYFAMEGFIHKSARVHFIEYFEKAKAMHKEEITQAWKKGDGQFDNVAEKMSLEYYVEKFGGNK